ncbi:C40 family peptidase [Methylomonas paludis]|uniref:C40 family peptidase n=1 Tax=Methylomonas paludis TaxID=1173101 RepID=A0A975RAR7_9GAMM|nr:C40 family peptidase [Methylomonas paludis]
MLVQLFGCSSSKKLSLGPDTRSGTALHHKVVNDALQLQGQPYVMGGESPDEGFDCSGLVYYVYNKQGLKLPRDTWSLGNQLPSVQMDERQPGDLVFFSIGQRPLSHVGIYVGDDRFVHAASKHRGKVIVSDLKDPYWHHHFSAVRRPHSR